MAGAFCTLAVGCVYISVVASFAPTAGISEDASECDIDSRGACADESSISLLQHRLEMVKTSDVHSHAVDLSRAQTMVNKSNAISTLQKIMCIQNTGGSCRIQDCAGWRGPTECSDSQCFCAPGYCLGEDGVCLKKEKKQVARSFTLRNARYPEHFMYLSAYGHQIGVSTSVSDQSYLNLIEAPGQRRNGGLVEYFLGSERWNRWAAAVQHRESCDSDDNCHPTTDVASVPLHSVESSGISSLAINLKAAPRYAGEPNGTQSLMIESYQFPGMFLSLNAFSWQVSVSSGDAGTGSYWIAEPPLEDIELLSYRGPRCSFNCGEYNSGTSDTSWDMLIGGLNLAALCLGCCISGAIYKVKYM